MRAYGSHSAFSPQRLLAGMLYSLFLAIQASTTSAGPEPGVPCVAWAEENSAAATIGYGDNSVTVTFPEMNAGTLPPTTYLRITAGGAGQNSAFLGDFASAGVTGVRFATASAGAKPKVYLFVEDANRVRWYLSKDIAVGADGTVVVNNLALLLKAGWFTLDPDVVPSDGTFASSLGSVMRIGLEIHRYGIQAQSCSVADFRLLLADETQTPSAVLMAQLCERFSVGEVSALTAEQRSRDSDGDGISDYDEIAITESDPDDADSALAVRIAAVAGGYQIEWNSVANGQYRIMRADGVGMAFIPIADVQTEALGMGKHVDPAGRDRCFYRVQQVR